MAISLRQTYNRLNLAGLSNVLLYLSSTNLGVYRSIDRMLSSRVNVGPLSLQSLAVYLLSPNKMLLFGMAGIGEVDSLYPMSNLLPDVDMGLARLIVSRLDGHKLLDWLVDHFLELNHDGGPRLGWQGEVIRTHQNIGMALLESGRLIEDQALNIILRVPLHKHSLSNNSFGLGGTFVQRLLAITRKRYAEHYGALKGRLLTYLVEMSNNHMKLEVVAGIFWFLVSEEVADHEALDFYWSLYVCGVIDSEMEVLVGGSNPTFGNYIWGVLVRAGTDDDRLGFASILARHLRSFKPGPEPTPLERFVVRVHQAIGTPDVLGDIVSRIEKEIKLRSAKKRKQKRALMKLDPLVSA
jgi:hypothetical protein